MCCSAILFSLFLFASLALFSHSFRGKSNESIQLVNEVNRLKLGVLVRLRMNESSVQSLAIVIDNDDQVFQTKYLTVLDNTVHLDQPFTVGSPVHIIIENVTKRSGSIVKINGKSITSWSTWSSMFVPDDEMVELLGKVVEVNGNIVIATCSRFTSFQME